MSARRARATTPWRERWILIWDRRTGEGYRVGRPVSTAHGSRGGAFLSSTEELWRRLPHIGAIATLPPTGSGAPPCLTNTTQPFIVALPVSTLDTLIELMNNAGYKLRELDTLRSVAVFEKEGDFVLMIVGRVPNAALAGGEHPGFMSYRDN